HPRALVADRHREAPDAGARTDVEDPLGRAAELFGELGGGSLVHRPGAARHAAVVALALGGVRADTQERLPAPQELAGVVPEREPPERAPRHRLVPCPECRPRAVAA